ncbi:RimJ/RimL family protein N-acetyltransferase [Pontibacter ummariensis]|uniref:Protein N-acetyltransferase, RimJ/RimL family n=1 Tax=Pontibacter ummariensis TaxID=1610492 RepID=A0A239HCV8_9BACT|nr:GNAT family N-acetyltransferase [Pontibacter ummariensis]PRY10654.1 RimJ/RimL family protein N-acetyltransferase [Pontibacter ummariensis]SNS78991.1 Protein N-acetyltransferase, RimJ/RimL family [Pontibacter ummariensis]
MSALRIYTDRLVLVPFTLTVAQSLLQGNVSVLEELQLQPTTYWPDQEALETLPKIINNLELVQEPTGFESWMVVLQSNKTVIGDAGFKGLPNAEGEVDIGYAIIEQEHRKGYGLEVARGLAGWALEQPGVKAITAKCLIHNAPSARILEKLGMQKVNRDETMIHWRLDKLTQQKFPSLTT